MSGFANSFWSSDYAAGLGVLFGKLQQGVQENQQVLMVARMRADAEDLYGQRLGEIGPATDRVQGGFARDDGASVRKAYEGVRHEMDQAARNHRKIASSIRELVINPFSRWCDQHEARVQHSQDDLQSRIKLLDRQADAVRKFRSQYYNKCRQVEDLEEEDKLAFQDPESSQSPKLKSIPTIKMSEPDEDEDPIDLGDETYSPDQLKRLLTHMMETVPRGETRVPILGVYQNVSNGADLTEYIQRYLNASSVSYAERIGQDLLTNGFLRLIGNVGSTFANSSRMNYQWRPKVFKVTGFPEKKKPLERTSTVMSTDSFTVDSPTGPVGEYLAGWNPLTQRDPNETPGDRLRREARESDERYKAAVRKLDSLRCNLEEAMIEHLKFMERCELDRLKAIKSVILDFSGAIGNVIPSLQSTVDNMLLFQETVQPLGDLRYLLENYRTGQFVPRVVTYENYYNSVDEQTFGVDLEARARSDRKRVPLIITTILTFLDNHYPDLEGDEARRGIWLVDVPLREIHHLRNAINTGQPVSHDVFERYDVPVVAAALKLYMLELPDSLVSSHVYEIVKTIYSQTAPSTSDAARVSVIQSTLGQLRLANIATLDALTTHFTRLIDLTSADEAYVSALSTALAPCILRPRTENSLTMDERYAYRLLRDLFAHKEAIFGELKRASALATHSSGTTPTSARGGGAGPEASSRGGGSSAEDDRRPRAISTDESNRRAHMEERQRAIANRSRASSPAPSPRHHHKQREHAHRRDRSSGGPETRFPIQTGSPTESRHRAPTAASNRISLDVPGSASDYAPATEPSHHHTRERNGVANGSPPSTTAASEPEQQPSATAASADADGVMKRDSLTRRYPRRGTAGSERAPVGGLARTAGLVGKRDSAGSLHERTAAGLVGKRDSAGSLAEKRGVEKGEGDRVGVELSDKPMDD